MTRQRECTEGAWFPQNHLIGVLPPDIWTRLSPQLEAVPLRPGAVLHESGVALRHAYFPDSGIVSLLCETRQGLVTESGLVGNEGMVGVELFLGGGSTTNRAIVQSAGHAHRLPTQALLDEFNRHDGFMRHMLRYTQSLITQIAQTAVCNRLHSIDQQLCRRLLLVLDRMPDNHLVMTQETIANALGVRREGVTEAAGKLQKLGVIAYQRGRITVVDRPRLERLSCECYGVIRKETDRLLSPPVVVRATREQCSQRTTTPGEDTLRCETASQDEMS